MSTLIDQLMAARMKSVPIISIACPDPAATIRAIQAAYPDKVEKDRITPLIQWDSVRGLDGLNDSGRDAVRKLLIPADADTKSAEPEDPSVSLNLSDMLHRASRVGVSDNVDRYPGRLPKRSILIVHNAHRHMDEQSLVQAIWNARDPFKSNFRTLILLAPYLVAPAEIADDILPLDEPLPKAEQLSAIIESQYMSAKQSLKNLPDLTPDVLERSVDALRGLSAFPAEQVTSLALTRNGLDVGQLWERKRKMVEQTPGLSIWRGKERFSDICGLDNLKKFLGAILAGRGKPLAIAFLDEIEKVFAGAFGPLGDSSGVSQAMLGLILSFMQDTMAAGLMLVGPAGTGKSLVAKAAGNEAGIPTVYCDLSGMKQAEVGESEANLRRALKVITAVSDNRCLFIATSNSVAALPPELKRRFQLGTVFVDLPSAEERKAAWILYRKVFELEDTEFPPSDAWTGSEIRACCEIAWRLNIPMKEAANLVVPIAISDKERIQALRQTATNRFISASEPGLYQYKALKTVEDIETVPFETSRGYDSVN